MKNIKNALSALALSTLFLFACTSGDDNGSGSNTTPSAGQWKITYFFDKQEKTGNYAGYTFEFDSNGSMSATNGGQTWDGTWLTGFDDSADKFLIDFSGTVPSALSELEEDWRIITMNDTFMHFEHTSGGNGDTDVVKFTRI